MKAKFFALAALVLGLASCQNDFNGVRGNASGEVDFQLKVDAAELGATRADQDGRNGHDSAFGAIDYLTEADWNNVDLRYSLEVYEVKNNVVTEVPVKDRMVQIVDQYAPVTFDLRLIPSREYRFVVFADFVPEDSTAEVEGKTLTDHNSDLGLYHTIGANLRDIKVVNDALFTECADAYFAFEDITINNGEPHSLVLKRPYGKLRVIATDLAEINTNVNPAKVVVRYDAIHPAAFNAVTGEIAEEKAGVAEYSYEYAEVGTESLANHYYTKGYDAETIVTAENKTRHTHMTLFTDYILAEDDQRGVHFTLEVWDNNGDLIKSTDFDTEIPVQRNHLTTIIGNVMTTATEINVTIDDNFENEITDAPYYTELWDGKTKKEPEFNAETNTYYIRVASELAWVAEYVNAGNTLAGVTVELLANIDLNYERWTPIGYGEYFEGTFNGNGWGIEHLFYNNNNTQDDYFVGLFGCTNNATIKNVNLIDVDMYVYGGYSAALVGAISGNTVIENVNVKGLVKFEGKMTYADAGCIGVIIGGDLDTKSHDVVLNNVNVDVKADSYVKGNTFVGGVVGQALGETFFTNVNSNIDVYAYNGIVGGIIGSVQHNSILDTCVASGNVTRVTAEGRTENQYKRIGGIAGTWESTVGVVELKNVVFNGELSTPDNTGAALTAFDYGKYVGRDYNTTASAKGKLIINGLEWLNYNTVIVTNDGTFRAANLLDGVNVSVEGAVNTNGDALEVFGNVLNFDMNGYEVKSGSAANYAFNAKNGADVTISEANINSLGGGIGVTNGSNVTFESGKIYVDTTSTSSRYAFYVIGGSTVTINGGEFSWNTAKNNKRAYVYTDATSTVYITGGTFSKSSTPRQGYILGDGTVIITGGTFGFDPSAWVADGYEAVKNGSNWVVSAK